MLGLSDSEIILGAGSVVMAVISALGNFSLRQVMAKLKDMEAAQRSANERLGAIDGDVNSVRLELERSKTEALQNFATKHELMALGSQFRDTHQELKAALSELSKSIADNYRGLMAAINNKADKKD